MYKKTSFIKKIFFCLIALFFIYSFILYLRPDFNYKDFFYKKEFWIIPIIFLFLTINYKRIFKSLINKILILAILSWGSFQFFPKQSDYIHNFLLKKFQTISSIVTNYINNLITPKDGTSPKFQIENLKNKVNINNQNDLNNNLKINYQVNINEKIYYLQTTNNPQYYTIEFKKFIP